MRIRPIPIAAAAIATAVAATMTAGCTTSAPAPQPTPTFGSVSVTPGMPGMGTTMPGVSHGAGPSTNASVPSAPVAGDAVTITDFKFDPPSLSVKAGTTVTWTNKDEEPHSVVASGGAFRSSTMGTGATFSYTFTAPGTFDYVCGIHPFMPGTVTVTP